MDKESKTSGKKRNLRLVEKYDSDDYSRYAGPDYSDEIFEIGEVSVRPQGNWNHPGVSGKDENETWVNKKEYSEQTDFTGYGPKNYKRTDDRIYEEVCDKLMRDKNVDASYIGVKVQSGVVYLSGKANSRQEKKHAELIVEHLPGVRDVRNELTVVKADLSSHGPDAPVKKDLGV